MIGTDGTGGAPMYARELHNMAQAGISNWEVGPAAGSVRAGQGLRGHVALDQLLGQAES